MSIYTKIRDEANAEFDVEATIQKIDDLFLIQDKLDDMSDKEVLFDMHNGHPEYYMEIQKRYLNAVLAWSVRYFNRTKIRIMEEDDIKSIVLHHLREMIWQIPHDSEYRVYTLLLNKLKYLFAGVYRYYFAEKRRAANYQYEFDAKYLFQPVDLTTTAKLNDFYILSVIESCDFSPVESTVAKLLIVRGLKPADVAQLLDVNVKSVTNAYCRIKAKMTLKAITPKKVIKKKN